MAKIAKLEVSMNGLLPTFVKLVQSWSPPKLKTETDYRDHLLDFIRSSVPDDARVEREYRHRGTTMDLYVAWKGIIQKDDLAFELKKDLKKKTDFDRLVGQIEGLDPRSNKILVVLIGETDEGLLGRLKEKYASELRGDFDESASLAIVNVRLGESRAKKDEEEKKDFDW